MEGGAGVRGPYGLNRVLREGLTEEVTFQQSWKKMVERALWVSAAGASQGCGNRMCKGPEVGAGRLAHSSIGEDHGIQIL